MDNPYASQFVFEPSGSSFVRMRDTRSNEVIWTGHYSRQARPMLDKNPPGYKSGGEDPHMRIIANNLNEAVKELNAALRGNVYA